MSKKVKLMITFAAGAVSGLMVALCAWVYTGRPCVIGGEVLILPLIGLLLYVGYEFGVLTAMTIYPARHSSDRGKQNSK